MLGDYLPAEATNSRKAALVSQGIVTTPKIVSRDENELYQLALDQFSAATQHVEFRALYVAMKNVDSFNRLNFHKERHGETW